MKFERRFMWLVFLFLFGMHSTSNRAAAKEFGDVLLRGTIEEAAKVVRRDAVEIERDSNARPWEKRDARERADAVESLVEGSDADLEQFRNVWRWLSDPVGGREAITYEDATRFLTNRMPQAKALRAAVHERRSYREFQAGRYLSAIQFAKRGHDEYRGIQSPHIGLGRTLQTIGLCEMFLSRHESATKHLREALSAFEESIGEGHDRTKLCKSHLAYHLCSSGKHAEAAQLLKAVREFNGEYFGDTHLRTLQANLFSGVQLVQAGELVRGIDVIRKTTVIAMKHHGEDHLFAATCQGHLGNALRIQGRYGASEEAFQRSLDIFRAKRGTKHTQACMCMWNLAFVQFLQNDFASSLRGANELLATQKAMGKNRSLKLVMDASELAYECQRNLGERPDAKKYEVLLQNGLRFHEEHSGPQHTQTATAMVRLAQLLSETNREEDALPLYNQAAKIFAATVGEGDARTIACHQRLGNIYRRRGETALAIKELTAATDAFEESRHRHGLVGLEHLSASEIDKTAPSLAILLAGSGQPLAAWFELERWRSRGLDDELQMRSGIRRSADSARARQLFTRVQRCVSPDTALVTWIGVWFHRAQRGEIWTCVVRAESEPQWLQLRGENSDGSFSLAQMTRDRTIMERISKGTTQIPTWDDSLVRVLSRERFEPLEPLLDATSSLPAVRNLIVALPGACDVPLEMLTDKFTISYVPSMSFLPWQAESRRNSTANETDTSRLLAVGDPDYGRRRLGPESMLAVKLQARDADRKLHSPLPGTRSEIEAIAEMFRSDATETLLGKDASESRIQEMSQQEMLRGFRFLHFAAHGEANPDVPMQSAILLSSPAEDVTTESLESSFQSEHVNDGRLTAEQVRDWKLDADLVTLSACETGLGPRIRGQHFIGFSQAFLIAGAQAVVVSNWQVRDDATSLLMRRFYQNMLAQRPGAKPMGKALALAEAKEWLRNLKAEDIDTLITDLPLNVRSTVRRRREDVKIKLARPFESPYFWAPFILIGDGN